MRLIEKVWFHQHTAKWLLVPLLFPLSILFFLVSAIRRFAYKYGWFTSIKPSVPVVIVGNIGIGGNGKTPVTLFLIEQLNKQGLKVGVISRGYGSNAPYYPFQVDKNSTADVVGDEPLLIARRSEANVIIGADRIASCVHLVEQGCDIIIADDGLQHYRLARTFEFVVIDGKRLFGNGLVLPAGPLREPVSRINTADAVIVNGPSNFKNRYPHITPSVVSMNLNANDVVHVATGKRLTIASFINEHLSADKKVNAIAGIGDPSRFFNTLSDNGFNIEKEKGFVDHQAFSAEDLMIFSDSIPLLMTEKDAVKCQQFAKENYWYLPVDAVFENSKAIDDIIKHLAGLVEK